MKREVLIGYLFVICLLAGCNAPFRGLGDGQEAVGRAIPIESVPAPVPTLISPNLDVGDDFIPELGNPGYDVTRYDIALSLDPAQQYVEGRAAIEFQVITAGMTTFALDFIGFEVEEVLLDGRPVGWERRPKKLDIQPLLALELGQLHTLTVRYQGAPTQQLPCCNHLLPYMGLQYPGDGTVFAANQPDGARYWFPANDHLEDKALFTFEISVPVGLTAVANGKLIAQTSTDTTTTFAWQHDYPMAPYLATVAVGPFQTLEQTVDGVTIRHYVLPELVAQFERESANIPAALTFMAEHFGAYPFESFGFVTVRLQSVSLETQTLALLSANTIEEQWMVHELAHMWFGDWVGLEAWDEMWRNEGFATWAEAFWLGRSDSTVFNAHVARWQENVTQRERGFSLAAFPAAELLGYEQYYKGALMVDALRNEMGDEAFFDGLRTYFQLYGSETASDEEFRAVMEGAAARSLQPVWDQWFTR